MEPQRLSRRVTALTGCSRSQAEQYIEGGWVLVDGEVIDEPQFMVDTQTVAMAPGAKLEPIEPATFLLHRDTLPFPADALSTQLPPDRRSTADTSGIRPLRRHFVRLQEGLPLEDGASGLAVLTQDGRLLRRLREEGDRIEQEFQVEVSGTLAPYGLNRLAHGLAFEGRVLPPAKVSWQNETRLRFALKGVRPGQLASMCGDVDLQVVSIRRLRIGRVAMGPMAVGEWRFLPVSLRF